MGPEHQFARGGEIAPIMQIARALGLSDDEFDLDGKYIAKVSLSVLGNPAHPLRAKYVVVTGITPGALGEGKTTTAVGLGMALNRLGHRAAVCLPQPSLTEVLRSDENSAVAGRVRVIPSDRYFLQLADDTHAVATSHNLLAAFLDDSLFNGNPHDIDPYSIQWPRVIDVNDRALGNIVIGLGGREGGIPRAGSFDLVASSEVMAVLGLANSRRDLRDRLGRIAIGFSHQGKPITAEDLSCAGMMAALLNRAIEPNLMQTLEQTPAFIHAEAAADSGIGNPTVVADQIAARLNDYVVTEAAFGSELGLEKFFDLKCRVSGLVPDAIVMVATIRGLKIQGGIGLAGSDQLSSLELMKENQGALERGCANLVKHVENGRHFGLPVIVALNCFVGDTDREITLVEQYAREAGAEGVYLSDAWARGAVGAISLAEGVVHASKKSSQFKFLYPLELPIKAKIERIAEKIYGAVGVDYTPEAEASIARSNELGWGHLPICMAKTPLSLSHDERLKGRPWRFRLPIRSVVAAVGAGFLVVQCGERRPMPALSGKSPGMRVDVDVNGQVTGLS